MLANALRKTTSRVTMARLSSSTSGSARNMQKLFIDYLDENNVAARRNVSSAPATKGAAAPTNAPTKDEAEKKPKMQKLGIDYLKEAEKKVAEKSGPVKK